MSKSNNPYGDVDRIDCKTNEDWREKRSHSIGASEVPVLFGEHYFVTPYELAVKKKEELKGIFNYDENEAMEDGHILEGAVAEKFSRRTGKQIIQASAGDYLLRRMNIPFMHCSPDRTYWIDPNGKKNDANKGVLECKTTHMMIDPENLPASWMFQLQIQMGIGGFNEGYLAWWNLNIRNGFDYKRFEFNPDIFDAAVEVCRDFWVRCVEGDETPEPVAPRDIVRLYPNSVSGSTITATAEIIDAVESIKDAQAAKKDLDESIDKLKNSLILMFTDEEAIVDPETGKPIVTYKTKKGATRVDSKKLKAEFPEVYEKVITTGESSRTLLIK